MAKKVFIGVAWPYVNGDIHIGHLAGYLLPADIYARFQRFLGNDVLMVSGSDCFGTPITLEAEERKVSPRDIVNEYHQKNLELFKFLDLSFDIYTKTDTENHKHVVQDFFIKLLEGGYIFKDKTLQYYSEVENRFLPDRYVEGRCPNCGYEAARSDQCDNCARVLEQGELLNPRSKTTGNDVRLKESEHYFLDWPKLQKFLEKYVNSHQNWRPWVLNETLGWLKHGLKPRPITRDLNWGVEIPIDKISPKLQIEGAQDKRIYVWFEAVIGYLSATIEWSKKSKQIWQEFWYNPDVRHAYFMGKDNLIFHTLFWPGQLNAYDEKIHLPDFPAINQFLTLEGQKFSKSRGITIDPGYTVENYGLDPVRFYLSLIAPENTDANFSWSDFVAKNNNVLIGNLGNFINRTLTLAQNLDLRGPSVIDAEIEDRVELFLKEAKKSLENFEFKNYVEKILALADYGNKYLSIHEPWLLKKDDPAFEKATVNSLFITLGLFLLLKPILPGTFDKLSEILAAKIDLWPENELDFLKKLLPRVKISNPTPLFKRIDESVIETEKAKIKF